LELILQDEYFFLHTVSSVTPIFAETKWNGERAGRQTDRQLAVCYVHIPQTTNLKICLDIGLLQN